MDIYAHRGASQQLPEHTLEAYALALEQGADRLELDLVVTQDGVLIARHDATLDSSTNVADVFDASRMSSKLVDGVLETGFFVSDFTFAEIQTLKARQTKDYRDQSFNDLYDIPSFDAVLELLQDFNTLNGTSIGIFPELKNPTFHAVNGIEIEQLLVDALTGQSDPITFEVDVQAFELQSLLKFDALAQAAGLASVGVHLATYYARPSSNPDRPLSFAYDLRYNLEQGNDLTEIYGAEFLNALGSAYDNEVAFLDLVMPDVLEALAETGIDGITYWLRDFIKRERLEAAVDLNGDGNAEVNFKYTGEISTVGNDAHAAGLEFITFTPRDEEHLQSLGFDGSTHSPAYEIALLEALGSTAVVVDNTQTAVAAQSVTVSESFLVGTGRNDTLTGSADDELISSGDGNDRVYGGKGVDAVFLGRGNDYVRVGGGEEAFHGGAGRDYISYYDSANGVNINLATNEVSGSWAVNDTISGFENISGSGTGNDTIHGTSGANTIKTFGGNDRVFAGKGNDLVELGDGNDYVRVGGGEEAFHGGAGRDYISYYDSANGVNINLATNEVSGSWAVNDTISGFENISGSGTGNDTIHGTSGANTIKTFGGNDELMGAGGDDSLFGGTGLDTLNGGTGNDRLTGGLDADVFHFTSGGGQDVIVDFEDGLDTIELNGFAFASSEDALGYASQSGSDLVFAFGSGDQLVIENMGLNDILDDLSLG